VLNDPGVPEDVSQRMFAHILLEEKENTEKLEEIHGAGPTLLTQKLLDHSFFIQRMLQEQAMSIELKRELLDHFMEEHVEWRVELLGPDAPAHGSGRPGVVSDFGPHQTRPSAPTQAHAVYTDGRSYHARHGHGGAARASHAPTQEKPQEGGRTERAPAGGGQEKSGQTGGSHRSDQKGKPSTAGATKREWTVGPLWSQGG